MMLVAGGTGTHLFYARQRYGRPPEFESLVSSAGVEALQVITGSVKRRTQSIL